MRFVGYTILTRQTLTGRATEMNVSLANDAIKIRLGDSYTISFFADKITQLFKFLSYNLVMCYFRLTKDWKVNLNHRSHYDFKF